MKKALLTLLAAAFITPANAQAQRPTQPADDDVVVISTNLIQVDVTVTDKQGKIIKGLKAEDFEIFENKEKQEISNFSFIDQSRVPKEASPSQVANGGEINAPAPPRQLRPENVRRTIAIVVDDLNLSFESIARARLSLKKFVDEQVNEGDLVAIIRTGAGIGALQQFTTDKRMLHAAIEKVRWNPAGSGNIGAFPPIETTAEDLSNFIDDSLASRRGGDSGLEAMSNRDISQEFNQFRENLFSAGTLGAINYIISGMNELPGRKSVLLLSDGFRIVETGQNGFTETNIILDALKRLVEYANRASVVIYSMDPRGLVVTGLNAADDASGLSTSALQQRLNARSAKLLDTQQSLQYLSEETGGFAVINSNDIAKGLEKIVEDQSGYYLIGYQPDSETFDPKTRRYNKLLIKVKKPGLKVRYRSGFFGFTDEAAEMKKTEKKAPYEQMLSALTSPFGKQDISLGLNALFGNNTKSGAYIRTFLHIDAKGLKFTKESDGSYKTAFNILALTFGDNGNPVDQISKGYTITLKEDTYKKMLEKGFTYNLTLPVKKPGSYQMRVALQDQATLSLGAANQFIEIPNLKKERLALSSIVLENLTLGEWEKLASGQTGFEMESDPLTATSLRQFRNGSILRFGFEAYNAKLDNAGQMPRLKLKTRIFRDGQVIMDGALKEVATEGQADMNAIQVASTLMLGKTMKPGSYVLQAIIWDGLAKDKKNTASQWIPFEIIE